VVVFDSWAGDTLASTPADDFVEPSVQAWLGAQVAIVDRGAEAGVYLWTPGEQTYDIVADEESEAAAAMARSFDAGLAWLSRRAETCRLLREGFDTAVIESCSYLRDMAVVPADGTTFLGHDDGAGDEELLRIDAAGSASSIDAPIHHLAYDPVYDTVYAAGDGESSFYAMTTEGGPVGGESVEGTLVDLAVLDSVNLLALLVVDGGDAWVQILDLASYEERARISSASAATALLASADGGTLAWLQPDRLVIAEVDWAALFEASEDSG